MYKLNRKGFILLFTIGLTILFLIGFFFIKDSIFEEEKPVEEKEQYSIALVEENIKITSTYLDAISTAKSSDTYTESKIVIEKGTKIKGYTLTKEQSFSKYIKLEGPDGKEVLTKKSNQPITHYAYTMLLTGDLQEKTNVKTKEKTYEIVNARITYNQVPLVLLSNENSVILRNNAKTKEKIVKLQDFINQLKSVEKRDTVISW